jgi:Zn-dependent protease
VTPPAPARCQRCATELAPGLLSCPACGTLVFAEALTTLARAAESAERAGDASAALGRWNEALGLLPSEARQRGVILARIGRLEEAVHGGNGRAGSRSTPRPGGLKGIWVAIASAVLFLLGKGKLLLLGFTKLGTLLSMAAFFGVYWGAFGWKFALGLVLSIYVHEMGHVAALARYGIPASAPMFIPGLGALVRLKARPPTMAQDARVGLAGPIWGTVAALVTLGLYRLTGDGLYAGLTHVGAVINLFNLIPIWQLDGGRGVQPLARLERVLLVAAIMVAFALTHEAMLMLVGIGLAIRCFMPSPAEGDRGALVQFLLLILALAALATVRAPDLGP